MIIVVGGIKGGGGKTTLATNLAVWYWKTFSKLLLVDADEQQSASSWAEQRDIALGEYMNDNFPTIALAGKNIYQQLQRLKEDYEIIIVDTGGRDTTSQRSALSIADKLLVPFKPRSLDVWTLGDVKRMLDEIKAINPSLKCYFVINQGDPSGNDNDDATNLISEIDYFEKVPVIIKHRKAFANAASLGLSVWEMEKMDSKACHEMNQCASFLYHNDVKIESFC